MITKHGELRARKRLGLPKKVIDKEFAKALESGKNQKDFKGSFKKYLDSQSIFYKSIPYVYNQNIYWVADKRLITVYQVPFKYRKHL